MTPSTSPEPVRTDLNVAFSWRLAEQPSALSSIGNPLLSARLFRFVNVLDAIWAYPLLKPLSARLLLFLAIASVCLLRAWIGLAGFQAFSHDAFMPLDGAWRLLNGQRPHLDFYSFMGVLVYVPTAVGLLLSRGSVEGFAYGQALVGLLLGAWAYLLTRKRLADVPAAIFTLAVVLLATTPFPLGYSPLTSSSATTYNRYGYAALALVLLECFAPRTSSSRRSEMLGGISTGSLAILLFFLKVTFFGAAVFLIGALGLLRKQESSRLAGLISGFSALALTFCAYFGFHMMPMIRDLIMVGGGKRVHLRSYELDSILMDAGTLACYIALVGLVLLIHRKETSARSFVLAGAAVCLTGVLLILGNCEPHGLPLSLFFVVIGAGQLRFPSTGLAQLLRGTALVWASVFTVASLAPSALSFTSAALIKTFVAPHETALATRALARFIPTSGESDYRIFVNDGIQLLEQHRRPADTVMSLDFSNPFSYGLGMKPASGGTTALHYQTTFNDQHRPSAKYLFGSANLVMVPKIFSDPSLQDSIPRLYGPYLASHFTLVGESARWRLYRGSR